MTRKEMRVKKDADLHALLDKWRGELARLKLQGSVGQCAQPSRIPLLKHDVARVKTILRERQQNVSAKG